MPGIPLLNLGTALGGFTQGYQNAENNRIQNALKQIALSQALSQRRSQALAGRGLAAGLLDQLQPNLPQMLPTGPSPMPTGAPTPLMPGAASVPATPPQTAAAPSEPPIDPDESRLPDLVDPQGSAVAGTYKPTLPGPWQEEYVTPQPTAAQMAPRAAPVARPQTADAGGSDAQPEAPETHVVAALPGGQQIGIPELFKVIDTTKIAQGLARLSPGADPADIYQATSDLLKLSAGNKNEQLQAAYLAKLMGINLNIQARHEDTATRAGVTERGQDIRSADAAAGRTAASERQQAGFGFRREMATQAQADRKELLDIREKAIDVRSKARLEAMAAAAAERATRAGNPQANARIRAIQAQISAIKAEGKTGGGMFSSPTISPENQKKLADLAGQLAVINGELATPTQPAGP